MRRNRFMCAVVLSGWMLASHTHSQVAPPSTLPAPKITWSLPDEKETPAKAVKFHGPFCNDNVDVTCEGFQAHQFLEITFNLLILVSWDGSVPVGANMLPAALGPDHVYVGLRGGPTLLYTTFSNLPLHDAWFRAESKSQNYPSQIPGIKLPPQRGAIQANSLGYIFPPPGPPQPAPMDAIYAMRFIVPHRAENAVVEFSGINLQDRIDEPWGVADFQVKPLTAEQVPRSSRVMIAKAFAESLNPDGADLPGAFLTLVCGMDETADWIEKNVPPAPVNARRALELIGQIQTGALSEQLSAGQELRALGHAVEPYLRDARQTVCGERRKSIDGILQTLGVTPIQNEQISQVVLAARILEVIGTPRALAVRRNLTAQ